MHWPKHENNTCVHLETNLIANHTPRKHKRGRKKKKKQKSIEFHLGTL